MKCPNCRTSGSNMRKCEPCGRVFCTKCAKKGIGSPKMTSTNKCPFCSKISTLQVAK